MAWHALDLEVELNAREAVEYALMEAGSLGTETVDQEGLLKITGYFSEIPERELVRFQLSEALRIYELPGSSVRQMTLRDVPEHDWLAEWKQSWQPVHVGRFVITPPWIQVQENDRLRIIIEPGMAFGTGTHATTRLCLAAIEEYFDGNSFLDVGTGTGILAIAAARLNPKARIEAIDTDPEAIAIAVANAKLNQVADRINFSATFVDEITASSDLVCANLTADVIIKILPQLLNVTCGRLILCGILIEQLGVVRKALFRYGVAREVQAMEDEEWAAIIV